MQSTNVPPTNHIRVLDGGQGWIGLIDHMGTESTITNAARVSFGKMKETFDEKDEKLLRYLIENKHLTPLEHVKFTFSVHCPLFVRGQWHRHRGGWCLTGDSVVTFNSKSEWKKGFHSSERNWKGENFTLEYLYNMWNKSENHKNRIKNMLIRVYDEQSKKYTVSNIEEVMCNGEKEVFEIELESGKKLKLTKDHKIMTKDGWQEMQDAVLLKFDNYTATMQKDCEILVNGVEIPWKSYDWMKKEREEGYSVSEIAEHAGCSYHNIRKWLKIHGLKFNHLDNLSGVNGKPPWNKGLSGYKINRVVTEEEKNKVREARSGEKSNFWKGGVSTARANVARWTTQIAHKVHEKNNYICQECGKSGVKLHAHHIVPVGVNDNLAYDFNNLTSLCTKCHSKKHVELGSYKNKEYKGLFGHYEKIVSVKYVGIQNTYDLTISGDNHNFLANGILVHNCYNEISRRYTEVDMEYYIPEKFRVQSENNKQASVEDSVIEKNQEACEIYAKFTEALHLAYEKLLELGVCKEQARGILPQTMFTTFWATVDLRNLLHFIELRDDDHAQKEIREYAKAMKELIRPYVPHVVEYIEKNK